jgi:hypothetical protein
VRNKTIILVAMIAFLIYCASLVYIYSQYPGYDQRFPTLMGGIQITITNADGSRGGIGSFAFPVYFSENGQIIPGFITAGHAININEGINYVFQPNRSADNYIGRGIRSTWPFTGNGVTTDLDAALIRNGEWFCFLFWCWFVQSRDFKPFIYENGIHYFGGIRDANSEVGIRTYIQPQEGQIVHKSGRSTGVTYGQIVYIGRIEICAEVVDNRCVRIVYLDPGIRISRCPNNQCFYNDPISAGGDSGGPVYLRNLISCYRIDSFMLCHYEAYVVGIVSAGDGRTILIASIALRVINTWRDVTLPTCTGGSSCW